MIARVIQWACEKLASKLEKRTITRGWNGEPYLDRYYIFRRRMLPFRAPSWLPGVYLHHFLVDDDQELHNHPWSAVSLILTGGYREWRRDNEGDITWRDLKPGMLNKISPDDFHRVELLDPKRGAWTLFFYGAKTQTWGFWSPFTNRFVHWRQHRLENEAQARAGRSN